jgi:putative flippase GtrA
MLPSTAQDLIDRLHAASLARGTTFKAVSFGLIGFVNTAIDFGIFSVGYYLLDLPIVAANLLSWMFAVSASYVMNSMITFSVESGRELTFKTYATFILASWRVLPQIPRPFWLRLISCRCCSERCWPQALVSWSTSRCHISSCSEAQRLIPRGNEGSRGSAGWR